MAESVLIRLQIEQIRYRLGAILYYQAQRAQRGTEKQRGLFSSKKANEVCRFKESAACIMATDVGAEGLSVSSR